MQAMIAARELLDPTAFAENLGWTRQALSKALAANRIFFVELDGARYYPAFFTDSQYEMRQLEAVTKLLRDLLGGTKLQFFLKGKDEAFATAEPLSLNTTRWGKRCRHRSGLAHCARHSRGCKAHQCDCCNQPKERTAAATAVFTCCRWAKHVAPTPEQVAFWKAEP